MAGVPVIAAGHGAVPELVAEGLNGALFEPGNARSLAEAMRRVFEDGIDMQARVDDWPANPSLDDHVRELVRLYGAQA
jgi:glycosyltransferase involved in cell wall biosynthesis